MNPQRRWTPFALDAEHEAFGMDRIAGWHNAIWDDLARVTAERDALRMQLTRAIPDFVARVNARAEAEMLAGRPVTGAHHRAIEAELKEQR